MVAWAGGSDGSRQPALLIEAADHLLVDGR